MSQQEEGGFHTCSQLFFSCFYFLWSTLSTSPTKCDDHCFLGTCLCLCFLTGIPLTSSPLEIIVRGGGKGGSDGTREGEPELPGSGREAFPPFCAILPVQAQESGELRPEAAVSHSEGFRSRTGPELCVMQKLSKTMAIPLSKISFFRPRLTIHYCCVS